MNNKLNLKKVLNKIIVILKWLKILEYKIFKLIINNWIFAMLI